ncbi:porphobilinogen deaminase [Toxoplasma gondii GAB2-2007-GAL-DOM2]|uniref:hydroxymethylbilane synthase n=6 Tax=Toxoplasma gondii TaxID=5811 RepID=S7V4T8_TOXGG|nr:porphobilinogen deaminase [Toxoplasma gondii GT1]KAF4642185.1 porphobilinogen deaminase [Toxoplasma gondii]KFG43440.1 porphobilinogen deaminase [Toxoplasma gondii GAB2-2007-GAL-DOM2]KFG54264.1 porphobilinogen deaminase [Toxoplasma gondii FOU]PUA92209.1 porphobilinogen deaminase [Toxoplasma gondii TgCATBr9]RQX75378.1 porphobilinogen deaminase [Toxoplasma gondii CAST]
MTLLREQRSAGAALRLSWVAFLFGFLVLLRDSLFKESYETPAVLLFAAARLLAPPLTPRAGQGGASSASSSSRLSPSARFPAASWSSSAALVSLLSPPASSRASPSRRNADVPSPSFAVTARPLARSSRESRLSPLAFLPVSASQNAVQTTPPFSGASEKTPLRVGSRASPLALAQARQFVYRLALRFPDAFPQAHEIIQASLAKLSNPLPSSSSSDSSSSSSASPSSSSSASSSSSSSPANSHLASSAFSSVLASLLRVDSRLEYGELRIVPMQTTGDKELHLPLAQVGGKGLFTKELDLALLHGQVDVVVHSLKDVPTELPEGTEIGAYLPREDPRDALIFSRKPRRGLSRACKAQVPGGVAETARRSATQQRVSAAASGAPSVGSSASASLLPYLPDALFASGGLPEETEEAGRAARASHTEDDAGGVEGEARKGDEGRPRIGTCSLRRQALLYALLPPSSFQLMGLRGNVQTRMSRIEKGTLDATLLAAAGLKRLNLLSAMLAPSPSATPSPCPAPSPNETSRGTEPGGCVEAVLLPADVFVPAVCQGIIGVQCRSADTGILSLLRELNSPSSRGQALCERAFLRALDGSCRTPIAGIAEWRAVPAQGEAPRPQSQNGSDEPGVEREGEEGCAGSSVKGREGRSEEGWGGHPDCFTEKTELRFCGVLATPDGKQLFREERTVRGVRTPEEAEALGRAVAEEIKKAAGADRLAQIKKHVTEGWKNLKTL